MELMPRIQRILEDPEFMDHVKANARAEATRIFCRHDPVHCLDVCRIARIMEMEAGLKLGLETVYAAGLLHDIGRWQEVATGIDHAQASAELAIPILKRCAFTEEESTRITEAISAHRSKDHPSELARILYEADKASRMCLVCDARGQCKRFRHGETFQFLR